MNNPQDQRETTELTVDLRHILQALIGRAWLLILAGILAGGVFFGVSKCLITPMYQSSVLLYVNNANTSEDASGSVSSADIDAAKKLVQTYIVILENKTTLDEVIQNTDVPYDYRELSEMLECSQVNDTEIFEVTVTSPNPYEAALIANEIAAVLSHRVAETIDGSSMRCVDAARVNPQKVSPSVLKNTALGIFLGVFFAAAAVVLLAVLDGTVHSEEYILQTYSFPVLARIPNFYEEHESKYAYYKKQSEGGNSR